jgi:hypothetical protein
MAQSSSSFPSLGGSARLYWRSFIYAWLEPVFILVAWPTLGAFGLLSTSRSAAISLFVVIAPTFFFADYKARRPLREGKVTRLHYVVWATLIPFAIWVALLSLIFVPALLLEGN